MVEYTRFGPSPNLFFKANEFKRKNRREPRGWFLGVTPDARVHDDLSGGAGSMSSSVSWLPSTGIDPLAQGFRSRVATFQAQGVARSTLPGWQRTGMAPRRPSGDPADW